MERPSPTFGGTCSPRRRSRLYLSLQKMVTGLSPLKSSRKPGLRNQKLWGPTATGCSCLLRICLRRVRPYQMSFM